MNYNSTPAFKLENLLLELYRFKPSMGQDFPMSSFINEAQWKLEELGMAHVDELLFYIWTLVEHGWIKYRSREYMNVRGNKDLLIPGPSSFTYKGLDKCISLQESGINSIKCFVAMSFREDTLPYYEEAIVPACAENGYQAHRVDRGHANSEQTINDFIIASIKQSRFCIADFTYNSMGVYFEAGYALGRGLKVIYTCHADHFDSRHFDIKPLQFIKYENANELNEALSLKIQAFI